MKQLKITDAREPARRRPAVASSASAAASVAPPGYGIALTDRRSTPGSVTSRAPQELARRCAGKEVSLDSPEVEAAFTKGVSVPVIEAPASKPPVDVKVKVNGPATDKTSEEAKALVYNAKDYKELYAQVSKRADSGKEAGFEQPTMRPWTPVLDDNGTVTAVSFTIDTRIALPGWLQKASRPEEDRQKFDTWRASVAQHEQGHFAIDKNGFDLELKRRVVGPVEDDLEPQVNEAVAAVGEAHRRYDKSTQPAGLPVPGGITKVGENGARGEAVPAGDTIKAPPAVPV